MKVAPNNYIGVLIEDINDRSFETSQPFLVQHTIASLLLDEYKTRGRNTLVGKPLLNHDLDGCQRRHKWLYREGVGMLSHL